MGSTGRTNHDHRPSALCRLKFLPGLEPDGLFCREISTVTISNFVSVVSTRHENTYPFILAIQQSSIIVKIHPLKKVSPSKNHANAFFVLARNAIIHPSLMPGPPLSLPIKIVHIKHVFIRIVPHENINVNNILKR